MTDIAPRSRPGYRSPRPAPSQKMALIAHVTRGLVGVVCLGAAVLYLPVHFITPVLSGVSFVMIVTGALGAWRCGRADPQIARIAQISTWGLPILSGLVFILMAIFGAGGLGPDWTQVGRQ
jgi:hypothetical protein